MNSIPVDSARLGLLLAIGVAPDTDREGNQKADRDGVPQWKIECLHRPEQVGDFAPKAGVEVIKIASSHAPRVQEMAPVQFQGLAARMWEMNGKSGLSLSATGVVAAKGGE